MLKIVSCDCFQNQTIIFGLDLSFLWLFKPMLTFLIFFQQKMLGMFDVALKKDTIIN
jgi:hypothetical protein